jgi:hypothetical protein
MVTAVVTGSPAFRMLPTLVVFGVVLVFLVAWRAACYVDERHSEEVSVE